MYFKGGLPIKKITLFIMGLRIWNVQDNLTNNKIKTIKSSVIGFSSICRLQVNLLELIIIDKYTSHKY